MIATSLSRGNRYTRRWPSLPAEICLSACFVFIYFFFVFVLNFLGSATLCSLQLRASVALYF